MLKPVATREEYTDFIFDGKIPEGYEVDKTYYATGRFYHMFIEKPDVAALYRSIDHYGVIFTVLMPCGSLVYSEGGNQSPEYISKSGLYLGDVPVHTTIKKKVTSSDETSRSSYYSSFWVRAESISVFF